MLVKIKFVESVFRPIRELKMIIDKIDDKNRVGVCIDTCHAMAAGYDLSKQEGFDEMLSDLGEQIGFSYLVAMHLNDSKGEAGCHLDRHENIGKGKIGIEGFRRVMNCSHFNDIPLILETPYGGGSEGYAKEIKLLESLIESDL
jgi:AP endonuclease-1